MPSRPLIISDYPHILHGGDYNPDQWLAYPEIIDDDFRLMKLAGCNTFSVGIFSWTSYEAEEGVFTFDWLDSIMDRMAAAGNKVILATPSGAKPNWMAAQYPEIRRVNRQGLRAPQEGRHNHCWSSPIYREKVQIINTKLAERYQDHPALAMWHLSNEYSGECVCELCLVRWQNWLKEKYGTLEALNHAWWTYFWSHAYMAWEQIIPQEGHHEGLNLDWMRFQTWQVADFFRWESAPLKQITPGIPCTTNFMGLFPGLDYGRLADEVDLITDDQYPAYDAENPDLLSSARAISFKDDLYRCFKPEVPFMLMESCPDTPQWRKPHRLKQPGLHQSEMLQALGHGMEGTCYFQWRKGRGGLEKFHGAVVDHNNHENTRVFQTVADLGKLYQNLTPILGSQVTSKVGLIYDWEVRWAFNFCDGPASQDGAYERVCIEHYAPFWEQGISVDIFHSERDFGDYKVLIAPQLWMLKPGVAERLRTYVEKGGTLVTTAYTGIVDQTDLVYMGGWPGAGLIEVFGIWNEETDVLRAGQLRGLDVGADNPLGLQGPYQAQNVCALVQLRGAQALATYGDGFYAGTPALTVHTFGKGQVYYQAAQLTPEGQRDFYGALIGGLDLARPFQAGLPEGVACQVRHQDGRRFFFLQNFSAQAQTVKLDPGSYACLSDGAILTGNFKLSAFGSDVLAKIGMLYTICTTLGPSTPDESTWADLLQAGATGFRLNTSHLSLEMLDDWLARLVNFRERADFRLVLDLQGSKWRLGTFEPFRLEAGQTVDLVLAQRAETPGVLPVPHDDFFRAALACDGQIVLNDAKVHLMMESASQDRIMARVILPGKIAPRKGITLPVSSFRLDVIGEKDQAILQRTAGIDFVDYAISYLRDAVEMSNYRRIAPDRRLIAKLERQSALDEALAIAAYADELWLCRGDLGAELGLAGMAQAAHRLAAEVRQMPIPILLAGQVLEHTTDHAVPTRAEICGLYDALCAGYTGVVLSDETAIGCNPLISVQAAATFKI